PAFIEYLAQEIRDSDDYLEGIPAAKSLYEKCQSATYPQLLATGVCVLAAQAGAKVHVIDVGIDSEPLPGVVNMRVARGCGNIA
ncbi:nicotinate-nucleotide--dimethylbenzimidazole phosphoribosyltransferase, partial [Klebsiella pneumoniae]|uniref:nicotinate-nucleotide--dimethylbenzimidazole phosphoribosyltransferase n=1 Tax=Klebsiella pneumoniae TaxID=573 RepID=UPI00214B19B2